jgi:hypothetical protein
MRDARIHLMFVMYGTKSSSVVVAKSHSDRGHEVLSRR